MNVKKNFRKNLRKLMSERGYKSNAEFGEKVGMSPSKIQRLSSCSSDDQMIDLGDAAKIAVALGTTLGHMTGAVATEQLIEKTKTMHTGIVGALGYLEKDLILRERRIKELKHDQKFIDEMLSAFFPLDAIEKKSE